MSRAGRCRCPGERRERVLTFLAQLCVRSSGYRLRDVSGWAHAKEVERLAGTYEWAALLAALAGAGLVDEQAASISGVEAPARLYRITQAGMDTIARVLRECAPTVLPPGLPADCSEGVYASEGARWGLDALREAQDGKWLSAAGMRVSQVWNRPRDHRNRRVFANDLDELVSSGLAESQREGIGTKARTYYRATAAGRTAKLLEWFGWDPDAPIYTEHDGGRLLVPPLRVSLYGSGN